MKTDRMISYSSVDLILRWLLGGVFIFASMDKMLHPADFALILYGYNLFPAAGINILAIIVPYVEAVMGGALIAGVFPRSSAMLAGLLLAGFITAISINLIRGHEFDCGCFSVGGGGHTSSAWQLWIRDVLLLLVAVTVVRYAGDRRFCLKERL